MTRLSALLFAGAGVLLGIAAYQAQTDALHSPKHAVAQVALGWAYLLAGLIAWTRRPGNRMGPLMVLAGFALLARQLRYSDDALVFTVFFVLGDIGYALVAHSALAYPFGRVTDRYERVLVIAGYATVVGFSGHAVGESNAALKALIGAASEFVGPGFLLPTRNGELFRWCLAHGLRVVQPVTLMSLGLYNEPRGVFLPSITY